MRVRALRPTTVAAATFIVLASSGCSSDNNSAAPTTAPKVSVPAPTTPVAAQIQAIAQAGEALKRYVAVESQMSQDPSSYTSAKAAAISTGAALQGLTASMTTFKDEGLHTVGQGLIVSMPVGAVDLTSTPDAKPPRLPSVTFNVCYKRGNVDIVDKFGKSQVAPGRTAQVTIHYLLSNHAWPAADGWRVDLVGSVDQPCTA